MGAEVFTQFERRKGDDDTPTLAFRRAHERASWYHGHGGYTGSLAEKEEIVLIAGDGGALGNQQMTDPPAVDYVTAQATADRLIEHKDPRIDDKWGPAGCIRVRDTPGAGNQELDGWLYFGWASS